ncbi:WD40 repeat domain-containing protein [Micromonospora sp. DH14]|uniref:WD40 repeat domain-containing protein n=1 Tax=Micromonospora sp. DH14 TaxID=3040120 RepID=UPI0024418866|nr:WD40 repeat domain-containing protein [Micromonospora sp. DH14]MDG9677001.1 WD40 repeat domain-containing protein [Micromonospora sp. DH14]
MSAKEVVATGNGCIASVVIDEFDHVAPLRILRPAVAAVVAEFGRFGLTVDPFDLARDGSEPAIRRALGEWTPSSDELVVLYWAGHGSTHGDHLYLWSRETPTRPRDDNAVAGRTLGQLLAAKKVKQILLLIDACSAAGGVQDIAAAFRAELQRYTFADPRSKPSLAVIGSADHDQPAREAAFTTALALVLRDDTWWTENDRYVYTMDIVDAVTARFDELGLSQAPQHDMVGSVRLPNPHYNAVVLDGSVPTKQWRRRALSSRAAQHFVLKYRGIDLPADDGWHFAGRRDPLLAIVGWLRARPNGMLVVTGSPGSGKSALLGRLAVLSDPYWRGVAVRAKAFDPECQDDTDPGVGAIDVGLHAKNKTLLDCLQDLADALDLPSPIGGWSFPGRLVAAVGRLRTPLTIMLDALDEAQAVDQWLIVTDLLRPLSELPFVKVMVGTRPHRANRDEAEEREALQARGLVEVLAPETVVQLDDDPGAVDAVAEYVRRRLLLEPGSAYRQDAPAVGIAAQTIAEHSGGVFLFGRLISSAVAHSGRIVDFTSAGGKQLLAGGVGEAFAADLQRYGDDARRVRELLLPLAWAQGHGLPRRQIWLTLANALRDRSRGADYRAADISWILAHAGAHIIESGEDEQTVYRLYHQSYNDHLRRHADVTAVQSTITSSLVALVNAGGRRWDEASPYLRRHLAAHAAAAGRLGELVADPHFLYHAEPLRLLQVLGTVDFTDHVLCRLYWRAADEMANASPVQRAALLQSVALRDEPTAVSLLDSPAGLPWKGLWSKGPGAHFHRRLPGHRGRVQAIAFGEADGRQIVATGGTDATIRIAESATGQYLRTLPGHSRGVERLAFGSIAGQAVLASGSADGTVRLWNPATGEHLHTISVNAAGVSSLVFCTLQGRTRLVTGGAEGRLWIWDPASSTRLRELPGHRGGVRGLAVLDLSDGPLLASAGGSDLTVRLWDLATGECTRVIKGHRDWVNSVALGRHGDKVVVASGDSKGVVQLFDVSSGQLRWRQQIRGWIHDLTFVKVRGVNRLALARSGLTIPLIDPRDGTSSGALIGHYSDTTVLATAQVAGRSVLASGGRTGFTRLWDCDWLTDAMTATHAETAGVVIRALPPNGGRALIVWQDGTGSTAVGEVATGEPVATIPAGRFDAVTVRSDRRRSLLGVVENGHVHVVDVDGRRPAISFPVPRMTVANLALDEFGDELVMAAGSPTEPFVEVWTGKLNSRTFRPSVTLLPISQTQPRYGPAGARLTQLIQVGQRTVVVAASTEGILHFWDGRSGEVLKLHSPASDYQDFRRVGAVATSETSSGARLVTAFELIEIEATQTGLEVRHVRALPYDAGYPTAVNLAEVAGETHIVIGNDAGWVGVWHWESKQLLWRVWQGYKPSHVALFPEPTGRLRLLASGSGRITTYDLNYPAHARPGA